MTPADFAARMGRKAQALGKRVYGAEKQSLKALSDDARTLSSGPLTLAQLSLMGHPYARRRPTSSDPEVINAQTGAFRAAWHASGPSLSVNDLTSTLDNSSPVAVFLAGGTTRMIARPIRAELVKRLAAPRKARLQKAVTDALATP